MKKLRTVPCLDIRYVNLYNADDVPVVDKAEPVATTLLRADADALVEAVDFCIANRPKPGAVPSEVGVKAFTTKPDTWYYYNEVWVRSAGTYINNHIWFLELDGCIFALTLDTIVYPIAAEEEAKGCPECHGVGHRKLSPNDIGGSHYTCIHCQGTGKINQPEAADEPDCTVGDLQVVSAVTIGDEKYVIEVTGKIRDGKTVVGLAHKILERLEVDSKTPCRRVKEE